MPLKHKIKVILASIAIALMFIDIFAQPLPVLNIQNIEKHTTTAECLEYDITMGLGCNGDIILNWLASIDGPNF